MLTCLQEKGVVRSSKTICMFNFFGRMLRKYRCTSLVIGVLIATSIKVYGHPGGNMITVGKYVLWSYISPIEDTAHHACVMLWSPGTQPEILIRSEFQASDYFFYADANQIYILEQRYLQQSDIFEIRILKTQIGETPIEIWGWQEDPWRIGDGGFFMNSDQEIIFGRYPDIYTLKKGQQPKKYIEFNSPIKRIRAINKHQILLLGDSSCWLTDLKGNIIQMWPNLVEEQIDNAPLNRNQIFDADFKDGELLLAYWGKRSFELFNGNGIQKTIVQMQKPLVPHWVAFFGKEKLLFSSRMVFDGEAPRPNLILYNSENEEVIIWNI